MNRMYWIRMGANAWNAEQQCWTVALQAATTYSHVSDLPSELPDGSDPDMSLEIWDEAGIEEARWYRDRVSEPTAWTEEV